MATKTTKGSKNRNSELGAFTPVNLKDVKFVNKPTKAKSSTSSKKKK